MSIRKRRLDRIEEDHCRKSYRAEIAAVADRRGSNWHK